MIVLKFDYTKFIIYAFIIIGILVSYDSMNERINILKLQLKAQDTENRATRIWLGELDTKVNQLSQQFDNKNQICN